jgi:hypothetical protein
MVYKILLVLTLHHKVLCFCTRGPLEIFMTPTHAPRSPHRLRLVAWSAAGLLLLLPLIAMQFTDEVNWTPMDFVFAAGLLAAAGIALELGARASRDRAFRIGIGAAVAAAFLLVWSTGAVGLIGSEDHPANLLYLAVIAVAVLGSLVVRLQAALLARVMYASAFLQALIGAVALVRGWGAGAANWPWDVIGASGFFTVLWLTAGLLFRLSAGNRPGPTR